MFFSHLNCYIHILTLCSADITETSPQPMDVSIIQYLANPASVGKSLVFVEIRYFPAESCFLIWLNSDQPSGHLPKLPEQGTGVSNSTTCWMKLMIGPTAQWFARQDEMCFGNPAFQLSGIEHAPLQCMLSRYSWRVILLLQKHMPTIWPLGMEAVLMSGWSATTCCLTWIGTSPFPTCTQNHWPSKANGRFSLVWVKLIKPETFERILDLGQMSVSSRIWGIPFKLAKIDQIECF